MEAPHLVYIADPMCSWCWGFSPVVQAITQRFGEALPLRLVLGGLRPWTREPMGASDRADVRSHWQHVQEASGQPFDFRFFEREGFVYDTEPASRAIVVLRRRGMSTALAALQRIQRAFYADNQDVTDPEVLSALSAELGVDPASFRAEFDSAQALDETRRDFVLAQSAGIRGFPTLIAGRGDDQPYSLITHGYQSADRILALVQAWLDHVVPSADDGAAASCVLH